MLTTSVGVAIIAVTAIAPVADAAKAKTKIMSVRSNGQQANSDSETSSISASGRFVAFDSGAKNLVTGDDNDKWDVFVHDRKKKRTKRVSVSSSGTEGNGFSSSPSISANGRFVAFASGASNLVPFDNNGENDIFVHDRKKKRTKRVSVSSSGTEGHGNSFAPAISANGRFVAFTSSATDLVGNDSNLKSDVFVHDRKTKKTRRVSVSNAGKQATDASRGAAISKDGRFVAFSSVAENLVGSDSNGHRDIFVRDRTKKRTRLISKRNDGDQTTSDSDAPSISDDGRYVAFWSSAEDLLDRDDNGVGDIFVHDRAKKKTKLVSLSSKEKQANGASFKARISSSGRYVAFESKAHNLVGNDANALDDIFVRDRTKGKTRRVSLRNGGGETDEASSYTPAISGDGRFVTFYSAATNLVGSDSNGSDDIFRRGPLH